MNIIPSIFNEHSISHAVLGGSEVPKKITMPVTCIVFMRGSRHYRGRVIENLLGKGFEKIISLEVANEKNLTEQLARQYPSVKFLVSFENVNQGELLNMAVAEAESEYLLVVQEEMCEEKILFNQSMAKKLIEMNQFCVCPRLFDSSMQKLPVLFTPDAEKSSFCIKPGISFADGSPTLFSADYAGFYNREKFILLGGIDWTIESSYWQKVDFFFRSWLWGEKTSLCSTFEFTYSEDFPEENTTVDISYLRFYLKNLLPVFVSDHSKISDSSFLSFKSRSSCGFVESMKQFKDAKRWTKENQYRFKMDAAYLVENWGALEENE